ncbi:hypothetical protein GCM10010278_55870 [Streptomyces melanogenes]|nr:hypothetical protein GCM10010278_55870 [Streptomyces melanogenes]
MAASAGPSPAPGEWAGCGWLSDIALQVVLGVKITQRDPSLGAHPPRIEEERNSRTGVATSGVRGGWGGEGGSGSVVGPIRLRSTGSPLREPGRDGSPTAPRRPGETDLGDRRPTV